jgi:hypothetical protein
LRVLVGVDLDGRVELGLEDLDRVDRFAEGVGDRGRGWQLTSDGFMEPLRQTAQLR